MIVSSVIALKVTVFVHVPEYKLKHFKYKSFIFTGEKMVEWGHVDAQSFCENGKIPLGSLQL